MNEIKYTLISVGKPYTVFPSASDRYADAYGQQLTDGQKTPDIGAHYVDSRMVGFGRDEGVESVDFTVDLGDDGKRISAIAARSLDMRQDGVALSPKACFYGSADGKDFALLGEKEFAFSGDKTVSTARIEILPADYRFIKITLLIRENSHFIFLDELEVYADVDEKICPDTVQADYQKENIDRSAYLSASAGKSVCHTVSVNAAVGSSYTFGENTVFDTRAPENYKFLADRERVSRLFGENVWVGISGENAPHITFDLKKTRDDLYLFRVHALGEGVGVKYPDHIDVFLSDNGNDFTFAGRMYAPVACRNYGYTLLLPKYVRARYVRFDFSQGDGFYWIEEVEIMAGTEGESNELLYPPVCFPTVTEESCFDESEPDYEITQNLILGKIQQISASFHADVALRNGDKDHCESRADFPYLTDGKRAESTDCYSGEWFFSRGGDAIDIFYDMEKLCTVEKLNISYLEHGDYAILRPKHAAVFLSEDGDNWYKVGSFSRGDAQIYQEPTRMELSFVLEKPVAARFVRFRFECAFLFVDELEVFGKKAVKAETARLSQLGTEPVIYYTHPEREQFATTENTPVKAKEIVITYNGMGEENMLLPFVAYLDKDGNIKDTFMDGFLACPPGSLPSGRLPHLENYKEDWEYVIESSFTGNMGFDELEKTVEQVKTALNKPDYKVQVYFSFLTLWESVTDFGDVDGDGISEDLSKKEDRNKVINWFIRRCEDEFNARGYKNLTLNGFYWMNESVIWEWDDAHIIAETGREVHKAGYPFLWIPYYRAHRFFLGYELGFDVVSMQPNFVFTNDAPVWRFESTASMTKARNMCVEIEHTYQALSDPHFARNYMLYLYYGKTLGYMDSIHIYYNDSDNFAKMAYSNDPLCRMQYDSTYKFTKGTIEVTPEKRENTLVSTRVNTLYRGTLNPENGLSLFTLTSSPVHGSVSLTLTGAFSYYPEKGYTGKDKFTYTYNNYLGESEECTVEITVEG